MRIKNKKAFFLFFLGFLSGQRRKEKKEEISVDLFDMNNLVSASSECQFGEQIETRSCLLVAGLEV